MSFKLKYGINKCTNEEYHGDHNFFSSSTLKLLLKDPHAFYLEKILKEEKPERAVNNAFSEGSLVHSMILEPEMIPAEYAFFEGMRKAGADWKAFKEEHEGSGKVLMSQPQKKRCEYYVQSYEKNKAAVGLITGGEPEHTICVDYEGLNIKVRTDYINIDEGYIVDVKTSAFPVDVDNFKQTVEQWSYELSAALYCKVAEQYYGKPFEFYFVAIAKKEPDCQVYRLGEESRARGLQGIAEAIRVYRECLETGIWKSKVKNFEHSDDYEILEV
jgi:hypothetical protein